MTKFCYRYHIRNHIIKATRPLLNAEQYRAVDRLTVNSSGLEQYTGSISCCDFIHISFALTSDITN